MTRLPDISLHLFYAANDPLYDEAGHVPEVSKRINNYCRQRFVKRHVESNARLYLFFDENIALYEVRDNPFFRKLEKLTRHQNGSVSVEQPEPSTFVLEFRKVSGGDETPTPPKPHKPPRAVGKPRLRLVK